MNFVEEIVEKIKNKIKYESIDYFDDKYVFKFSYPSHLIVMRKTNESITNECRNVINNNYAYYRGNVFIVELIIDIFTLNNIYNLTNYWYNQHTLYSCGKKVKPIEFDINLESVDSCGIHYFKTIEAVIHYCLPLIQRPDDFPSGWKNYDENGKLINEYTTCPFIVFS